MDALSRRSIRVEASKSLAEPLPLFCYRGLAPVAKMSPDLSACLLSAVTDPSLLNAVTFSYFGQDDSKAPVKQGFNLFQAIFWDRLLRRQAKILVQGAGDLDRHVWKFPLGN